MRRPSKRIATATLQPGSIRRANILLPRPTLNGQTASFIWCHWGDNTLTTAGQETVRLVRAMRGYDHAVLLKHKHYLNAIT